MRIAALSSVLLLCACGDFGTFTADPDYCGENDGDAYCGRVSPDKPYCVVGTQSCFDASGIDVSDPYGCVAAMPAAECRTECGLDAGDECGISSETMSGSSSSTGADTEEPATSTTEEPETDTEDPSTTTGPACSESIPCLDPERPFCIEGECTTCDAAAEPDVACAELDAAAPLCVDATCVQCTAEDASACEGTTPLCDEEENTCVGCSFHEECQDLGLPACNIATGACFSNDAVTTVNLSGANALQNAVNGVDDGAEHTLVVTGSAASTHSAVVDGGKSIAIVSTNMSVQTIRGAGGSPTLTVTGADSTVFLHRVRIEDSNDVGISVASGGTLYADSTQVTGNDGGGIELAAGTSGFLRNCMVAGDGGNSPAIASSGNIEVLYSTLGRDTNFGDPVLECSAGSAAIRNSIIVNQTNTAGDEVSCPGVSLTNTPVESTTTPADWFGPGFASGDYFLNATGQAQFGDEAAWEVGDPSFDFNGDDRPSRDGAPDFAGADVP